MQHMQHKRRKLPLEQVSLKNFKLRDAHPELRSY